MLEALKQRARARGLVNVSTLYAPAEELRLPAASFDGACSRFGVMFFGDPLRALANVRHAVRPGGRLVLAAWGARESNPFFTLPNETFEELGVPDPATAGARTVFEYSLPGQLAALLHEAGWHDVREERAALRLPLADTPPDRLLDVLADISRRIAERLQPLDAAARDAVRARLAQRAAAYACNDGVAFPAEVLFLSARS
jgi:SAM-dependent methyltransferase